MFQLRWKKEKAGVYHDGLLVGTTVYKDAVLQYRTVENPLEVGLQEPIWSDWEDVPTEWIET